MVLDSIYEDLRDIEYEDWLIFISEVHSYLYDKYSGCQLLVVVGIVKGAIPLIILYALHLHFKFSIFHTSNVDVYVYIGVLKFSAISGYPTPVGV